MERTILCMDMDAFFASVEEAFNPNLKGKPIAVVGTSQRTVITTSSYAARKFGVRTGMNKFTALKLCPNLIFIEGSVSKYVNISTRIAEFLETITPTAAMYSIDEAFMDIQGVDVTPEKASKRIKEFLKDTFDLTCTIGVGPNRLISKMATHINKPSGYYEVKPKDVVNFIDSFKVKDLWGVGKSLTKRFADLGIFTPQDVRRLGYEKLTNTFGLVGGNVFNLVSGLGDSLIQVEERDLKSISHSMTFSKDILEKSEVYEYLLQLSDMVSKRARRNSYSGKVLSLVVKYDNLVTTEFNYNLSFRTSSTHHIYDYIKLLFNHKVNFNRPIRLLGVALSGLSKAGVNYVIDDYLDERNIKMHTLYQVVDNINTRFGKNTITYASVMNCERQGVKVISPAWKSKGASRIDF